MQSRLAAKNLWAPALLLLIATAAIRADSFFHPLLPPYDEGAYYRMAVQFVQGTPLYQGTFDHKPPGIFFIFGAFLLLPMRGMLAIRLGAVIFSWLGALGLYILAEAMGRKTTALPEKPPINVAGLVAGLAYAACSTLCGGDTANTEIFFLPMIIWSWLPLYKAGLLQIEGGKVPIAPMLWAGLLGGWACIIKYPAGLETALLGGIWLVCTANARLQLKASSFSIKFPAKQKPPSPSPQGEGEGGWGVRVRFPTSLFFYALGYAVPVAGMLLYFVQTVGLEVLHYQSVTANLYHLAGAKYKLLAFAYYYGAAAAELALPLVGGAWLLWALAANLWRRRQQVQPNANALSAFPLYLLLLLLGWLITSFITARFTGHLFRHYMLEVLPPLCLSVGLLAWRIADNVAPNTASPSVLRFFLIALACVPTYAGALRIGWKDLAQDVASWRKTRDIWGGDEIAQMAGYFHKHLKPGEYFFALEGSPTLYVLSGHDLPTRYIFWPFLVSPHFGNVTSLDQDSEIKRTFALHPRYYAWPGDGKTISAWAEGRGISKTHQRLFEDALKDYEPDTVMGRWTIYKWR